MNSEVNKNKKGFVSKIFPTPKYLKMPAFGLDMTNKNIRLIKFEETSKGMIPKVYEEIEVEGACDITKAVSEPGSCEEILENLIKLKKKYKIDFVTTAIKESESYIFRVSIPGESENIKDAISFKLEENIPLGPDEVVFDYVQVGKKRGNGEIDFIVTATPITSINNYSTLIKDAGMIPVGFMTETQAISRAIFPKDSTESYLLIHVDSWGIVLSIVDDGVVQYVSSVGISSEDVIKDFDGPDAKLFKDQIHKLIIYWFTNKHDPDHEDKIKTAFLTGHYSDAKGFLEFLNKHSQVKVSRANVWRNCFDINEYVPEIKYEDSIKYAVAVGLAI